MLYEVITGSSELHASRITQHLLTNVDVVRLFLPVNIAVHGDVGSPGWVRILSHAPR